MKTVFKNSLRRALWAFGPIWALMAGIGWIAGEAGLGFGLGFVIAVVGWSLLHTQEMRKQAGGGVPELEDLHPYTRSKLQGIYRLHREIRRILSRNQQNWATAAVASEVKLAADDLLAQAYKLAETRRQVRDFLLPAREARLKLAELENSPAAQSVREALLNEIRQYESIEAKAEQLDKTLQEAEAALRELKSRLVVALGETTGSDASPDDLRDALRRTRSLGSAIEEAVETLSEESR
ncbi:MAG: hypothetical protein KatS3mg015_1326 [Fimbriimonadales bacterium]|nr:MAG: hypothetical protein KatS3mg015_1326 [Fimbriimonadales bacterium]